MEDQEKRLAARVAALKKASTRTKKKRVATPPPADTGAEEVRKVRGYGPHGTPEVSPTAPPQRKRKAASPEPAKKTAKRAAAGRSKRTKAEEPAAVVEVSPPDAVKPTSKAVLRGRSATRAAQAASRLMAAQKAKSAAMDAAKQGAARRKTGRQRAAPAPKGEEEEGTPPQVQQVPDEVDEEETPPKAPAPRRRRAAQKPARKRAPIVVVDAEDSGAGTPEAPPARKAATPAKAEEAPAAEGRRTPRRGARLSIAALVVACLLAAAAIAAGVPDKVAPLLAQLPLPEVHLPRVSLPDVALPDIRLPDVHLPEIHLPDIHLPDIHLPDIHLPDIHLPEIRLQPLLDAADAAARLLPFRPSGAPTSQPPADSCFADGGAVAAAHSPPAAESEDGAAAPAGCNMSFKLPCPPHGACRDGRLVQCEAPFEVSGAGGAGSECVLPARVRGALEALLPFLVEKSVAHICSDAEAPGSRRTTLREAELGIGRDLSDLLAPAVRKAIGERVAIGGDGGAMWVALSTKELETLPLPLLCSLRIMGGLLVAPAIGLAVLVALLAAADLWRLRAWRRRIAVRGTVRAMMERLADNGRTPIPLAHLEEEVMHAHAGAGLEAALRFREAVQVMRQDSRVRCANDVTRGLSEPHMSWMGSSRPSVPAPDAPWLFLLRRPKAEERGEPEMVLEPMDVDPLYS